MYERAQKTKQKGLQATREARMNVNACTNIEQLRRFALALADAYDQLSDLTAIAVPKADRYNFLTIGMVPAESAAHPHPIQIEYAAKCRAMIAVMGREKEIVETINNHFDACRKVMIACKAPNAANDAG